VNATLGENDVPRFPRLNIADLRDFTYGTFQIRLALSQDNSAEDREAEFQIDQLHQPGLLRRDKILFSIGTQHIINYELVRSRQ